MSSTQPSRIKGLRGSISQGVYAKGSKSERNAVFIKIADVRYVLRRKGGPVFGDKELSKYVGHEVKCDGFLIGTTLIAERIEIV